MFAMPVQRDTNETYDGLPMVQLHDDAEDLDAFIKFLYNFGIPLKRLDPDTPLRVQGILKLAAKYQVDSIRTRIVQRLEDDWPTSALSWLRFSNDERLFSEDCARYISLEDGKYPEDNFPEPAAAIRLARDFDIPSILPAAYLRLLYADPTLNWDDIRRKRDGAPARSIRSARWHLLDHVDMLRVAQGRLRLVQSLPHVHRAFLLGSQACHGDVGEDDEDEDGTPNCHQIIVRRHGEFSAARYSSFWTGVDEAGRPDPIAVLQKLRDAAADWKMCASCTELFRSKVASEIKRLWDDLPRIFGLVSSDT
ncbi:hypothetical protein PsYK624_130070 [Phanerochaete sordida]|uniref:BTB domain-containing protein n=1 Tax=Phanerochaete sordida TaxID=48140 RepID=A0A9P3GKS6_9APHY|nr:hypothetical protein PsYK624_130070 [Phanerochaete sordida]